MSRDREFHRGGGGARRCNCSTQKTTAKRGTGFTFEFAESLNLGARLLGGEAGLKSFKKAKRIVMLI